ncbi:MAG: hypothetical protein EXR93_07095 [Gemmatimonadetes bacterium]|nr:hypothetical protein [Gemmatimonadota bacterium]
MSRIHPFDYAFGEIADARFREVKDEAARAGQEATDPAHFPKLESVGKILAELAGESKESGDAFLSLLYSAYMFWDGGCRTLTATRPALEALMEAETVAPSGLPDAACYVQLPERWIWCRVEETSAFEPLDGLFLATTPGKREIIVLGVLGLHADRAGYSEVTAAASARGYETAGRAVTLPRFAPAMDGGAAAGMRSVNSNAELLLLASLALAAGSR